MVEVFVLRDEAWKGAVMINVHVARVADGGDSRTKRMLLLAS